MLSALVFLGFAACTDRSPQSLPPMNLSLHSGIEELVRLNDTEAQMEARSLVRGKKNDIAASSELGGLRFSHYIEFTSAGTKAYFRNGRVALIEIQDPFRGAIIGRKLPLFPFNRVEDRTWEDTLVREFGTPMEKSSGGRLSSDLLLYNWGDVAFNGLGPNQFAVYRDDDIATYRKRHFGRVIRFWK